MAAALRDLVLHSAMNCTSVAPQHCCCAGLAPALPDHGRQAALLCGLSSAKMGINGFSSIGRLVFRVCMENQPVTAAAVSETVSDPFMDLEHLKDLLKYDYAHKQWLAPLSWSWTACPSACSTRRTWRRC